MNNVAEHNTGISQYRESIKSLKENIYNSFVSLINDLTEGHTEGMLFFNTNKETITLNTSKYTISHIHYNKTKYTFEGHVANCMNSTPLMDFPAEDILQMYSTIFYSDKN